MDRTSTGKVLQCCVSQLHNISFSQFHPAAISASRISQPDTHIYSVPREPLVYEFGLTASEPQCHHLGAPHMDGKGGNRINCAGLCFLVVRSAAASNFQPLFWAGNGFHNGEEGTFYSERRKQHQGRF